jgi:hypothetical protein
MIGQFKMNFNILKINNQTNQYDIMMTDIYNVENAKILAFSTFSVILPNNKKEYTTRTINIKDIRILWAYDEIGDKQLFSGMTDDDNIVNSLKISKLVRLSIEKLSEQLLKEKLKG